MSKRKGGRSAVEEAMAGATEKVLKQITEVRPAAREGALRCEILELVCWCGSLLQPLNAGWFDCCSCTTWA